MKTNLKLHLGMVGLLFWSSAQCAVAADDVWPAASLAPTHLLGAWSDDASANFNMGNRSGLHLELYSQRDAKDPGSLDQVRTRNAGRQVVLIAVSLQF